jgi:hypothetical protein
MHSQWEDITPAIAREGLKTERCGRPPSKGVVERYARDMEHGRWVRSPEPVVYDGEDTGIPVLRDGKQRFLAILRASAALAEAGKIDDADDFSLTLWVTRGTDQEIDAAFPFMNIGKNRTGADYLAIEGRKNPTMLYTVARRIVLWDIGYVTGNTYKPTRAEVLETLEPREGRNLEQELARIAYIEAAAGFAAGWSLKPPVPPAGVAGLLWYLLGLKDPRDRDVFMGFLRTGSGLTDEGEWKKEHPLVVLRNRLHGDFYEGQRRGTKVKQETVLYLCLRAWEAWRSHEEMTKLQMPPKLTDAHFKTPR